MNLSIIIPILGQLNSTKHIFSSIFKTATTDFEAVIINNTPDPEERVEIKEWIRRFLQPINHQKFIYHEQDNPGMIKTMQKGYELATGDVHAHFHTDVLIYEKGWDERVLNAFRDHRIGLAGFFGHTGIHLNAGRQDCFTNMLEAEYHGNRDKEEKFVVGFDGFSIIARKEMLDKKKGFDFEGMKGHHVYDKVIGLQSLALGYKNKLIPIDCHHIGGQSANFKYWQEQANKEWDVKEGGDGMYMDHNLKAFNEIWGKYMPLHVDQEGNLSNDSILKHYGS